MTMRQKRFLLTFLNSFLPERRREKILKHKSRKNVAFLHALSLSLLLL